MPQWFYQCEEEVFGPVKASDLLKLVREQIICAETLVRKDESAWFPAGEVGGLFEAAAKPTIEYSCPDCGSTVGKPPCYCRRCRRVLDYARPKVIANEIEGYQRTEPEKDSVSDSWKQWLRRLKLQRDERFGGRPVEEQEGHD
jgi:hypothetical protein